ncbi:MAG TPA: hypothetical protein VHG29_00485 [Novosphingobium sp.]|nr:hypothetical protein [Novosphingobium sp.]
MSSPPPSDPFALFRNWVSEWEKLVNQHGAELLAKPEVAQAMQQVSSAKLQVQAASDAQMAKLLGAANLPSKADIEALGTRLAGIEATLARIEVQLRGSAGAQPRKPKPARTRKPGD